MTIFPVDFVATEAFRNDGSGAGGSSAQIIYGSRGATVHTQSVAATEWVISHPYAHPPVVQVTVGGELVTVEVEHADGQVTVRFNEATAGTASLMGAPGNTEYVEHHQTVGSTQWTINHNFAYPPLVSVLSDSLVEVEAEVSHPSSTQVTVKFANPDTGWVLLV